MLNRRKNRRRNEFDILSLFEGGQYTGWWMDGSDTSLFKQDASGSIPVSGDNDPVGYIRDKTGRNTLAAFIRRTSDSARPLYKNINGYGCLRFDGVDDVLDGNEDLRNSHIGQNIMTYCYVLQVDPTASYPQVWAFEEFDNFHGYYPGWIVNSTTARISAFNDPTPSLSGVTSATNKHVFTAIVRVDNVSPMSTLRINGVEVNNGGPANFGTGSGNSNQISLGNTTESKLDLYQAFAIYGKRPTTQELLNLEYALAAKAGMTF